MMTDQERLERIDAELQLRKELMGENEPSDTYRKNYLLEAGAGAGKTHTMVNRIINQLMLGEIRPENLVAITFTEKATQEMQERIDREISRRLKDVESTQGRDSERAVWIRELISELDRMQISTIHGFCRKLLITMPYESVLGPEFDIEQDKDVLAQAFLAELLLEEPNMFEHVQVQTGVDQSVLEHTFRAMCETGTEFVCTEDVETALASIKERQLHAARDVYTLISAYGNRKNYSVHKAENLEKAQPRFDEIFRQIACGEDSFAETVCKAIDPFSDYRAFGVDDLEHLMPRKTKSQSYKDELKSRCKEIKDLFSERIFLYCMPILRDMVERYRAFKLKMKVASQNDLLIYARDMLRDSAEARIYFHDRYKVIYVDEMQDTNPVQAQLLFYLTTSETDFNRNWERCKPVPGSLFMVGDPKQAIYRFVGADISIYKKLMKLFDDGIGEILQLRLNFRSSEEILRDGVDSNFQEPMQGSEVQAQYTQMIAYQGSSKYSKLITYEAERGEDPERVAALIAQAVHDKFLVGFEDECREVEYGDFMVLTSKKDTTVDYVRALAKYDIPCNMAGAMKFSDSAQITAMVRVIRYLADRSNEMLLTALLMKDYGIDLPILRAYRQRTGSLTADYLSVKKALLQEGQVSGGFEQIFAAMQELDMLFADIRTRSAMSVIEEIALNSAAVWGGKIPTGSREYALVTIFLNQLRRDGDASFAELVVRATDLASGKGDKELLLEDKANCVRVMNIHKAKGLEAEIIILANDNAQKKQPIASYTEYEGDRAETIRCIMAFNGNGLYAVGKPQNWSKYEDMERKFLDAEKIRLRYVAATRAKTCLIMNTGKNGPWDGLQIGECSESNIPEEILHSRDRSIRALTTGECNHKSEGEDKKPQQIASVADISARRAETACAVSACTAVSVTPSMFDVDMKKPLNADEPELIESTVTDIDAVLEETKPYGADWGTIMHRVMELAVRSAAFQPENIHAHVRQAIRETIGDGADLTSLQRYLLLNGCPECDNEKKMEYLTEVAQSAASFLCDETHELRRLIADAKCYTELPFILRESDMHSDVASAVRTGLAGKNDNASAQAIESTQTIDLNGIIDLAVRRGKEWIVIDYKTDSIHSDENEERYIERLIYSYTAQLNTYRSVLNRIGTVSKVFICALNLNGKLIEIS